EDTAGVNALEDSAVDDVLPNGTVEVVDVRVAEEALHLDADPLALTFRSEGNAVAGEVNEETPPADDQPVWIVRDRPPVAHEGVDHCVVVEVPRGHVPPTRSDRPRPYFPLFPAERSNT